MEGFFFFELIRWRLNWLEVVEISSQPLIDDLASGMVWESLGDKSPRVVQLMCVG